MSPLTVLNPITGFYLLDNRKIRKKIVKNINFDNYYEKNCRHCARPAPALPCLSLALRVIDNFRFSV